MVCLMDMMCSERFERLAHYALNLEWQLAKIYLIEETKFSEKTVQVWAEHLARKHEFSHLAMTQPVKRYLTDKTP